MLQAKAYVFLLPALCFYLIFLLYPLVNVVRSSFYDINTISQKELFVKFGNYIELFKDHIFLRAIFNTIIYTIAIIIFINALAVIFALILDREKIKGNYFLRVVFFIPAILAPVIIGTIFKRIFAPIGALNLILDKTGLVFLKHNWLGVPWLALAAVIITTVWQSAGWNMVVYFARLRELPKELYEAAAIDGASDLKIVRYIKLPLLREIIAILVVINIIGGFKVFDLVYIMTRGGPAHKTEVVTSFLYYQAFDFFKWGYASTVAVIMLIIMIFFTWLRLRKISWE
ncbi:MAG: carbohydrate ABC transporter permease [Candidatus Humimicrobiaceae bacterium]